MSEFYLGYGVKTPPGIHRRILAAVVFLTILAVTCAILFVRSQAPFAPSVFEFGKERMFEGTIEASPYPLLIVKRPGATPKGASDSRYLLVAAGKHGADSEVARFDGKSVRLRGSLIYRDNQTMIQLTSDSISGIAEGSRPTDPPADLGTLELTGEIVDSKCYLGVMNPGHGKVHRDCAVRCISGGVPPALAAIAPDGTPSLFLLTDEQNRPIEKNVILNLVDQPVRIRGHVLKSGSTLYLETNSANITPLP